ncbi:MAG: helix-turn-helix transcriptional regulator, partial [Gemmatimonadaceae bacterium]
MDAIKPAAVLIRDARARASLTQRTLAERASTSQSVVARIENGQSTPSVETVEKLLSAAGFTLRMELVPRTASDPTVEAFKRDIDRSLLKRN